MRRLWALSALLVTVRLVGADVTFTVRDYLHHNWNNELVTYTVPASQVPTQARLLDGQGKVAPVQIVRQGKTAQVSFMVPWLPADSSVSFRLTSGTPVGRKLAGPREESEGQAWLRLDAGPAAMLVPYPGVTKFPAETALSAAPAPLEMVRAGAEKWLGRGKLRGKLVVEKMESRLLADGPLFAEVRVDYTLAGGGKWSFTSRLVKGQPVVLVTEEFNMPAEAVEDCFFEFSLREGLNPERVTTQGRLWRKRVDQQKLWGDDYKLEFDQDRHELNCIGYVPWWPETARFFTLHGPNSPETVTFFPRRIGSWRNPMGSYLMTKKDGSVYLSLPLYVKQSWEQDGVEWGNQFYTGRLEAGWPRTALRRQWGLFFSPQAEAYPAEGRTSVADAMVKYSDLPLDKLKDWTFAWDSSKTEYPRLYTPPGKLEEVRKRAQSFPDWKAGLFAYHSRPLTYILTGDERVGDELLHAEPQDAGWFGVCGALPGLRQGVSMLLDGWGYAGFFSPNQARPMIELTRFDAAMSVATATPAEKAELQALAAFWAQMVYDPDWHAVGSGWHLGNPNMPPRQEHHLAVASAAMPQHPQAAAWRARGVAEQERILNDMVKPSGAWRECPHYQWEAAFLPLLQAAVPLKLSGTYDVFAQPKFKATWNYLVNTLTPPDPRFQAGGKALRVLPAFGNGSWEFMPLPAWIAAMTKESDPAFSALMQWAWQQQGAPTSLDQTLMVADPSLPAKQPDWKSTQFEGFGALLHSGFPSDQETWMAFRHGDSVEHYNAGDQGSFMLYAKGSPLVIQFGSQYTPYFQGPWYFNTAAVNHRPVRDTDSAAAELRAIELKPEDFSLGMPAWGSGKGYVMFNQEFVTLAGADYVRGEQFQERQLALPKDPTIVVPGNKALPEVDTPDGTWNRRVLFMKNPDPAAPNYFVMRDDFALAAPLPGEWNIWCLADRVETAANPATVVGHYGVNLDVFMATPGAVQWSTQQAENKFIAGGSSPYVVEKPWKEVLTNLRAQAAPGQPFLCVLFPRKAGEAPPKFEALAGGQGIKVITAQGTDWVFLSPTPVNWSGEGLSFAGTVGAIRQVGQKLRAVFLAPGKVTAQGKTVGATQAAELAVN